MQALAHQFKLDMVAVPFPGGAQLTTAILSKQIDIGMVPYTTGAGMFASDKLRPLITTAPNRMPQLPDVPTFIERGIAENGLNLVMGLYAPKELPDGVRNVLVDAVAKAARDTAFVAYNRFAKITLVRLTPGFHLLTNIDIDDFECPRISRSHGRFAGLATRADFASG